MQKQLEALQQRKLQAGLYRMIWKVPAHQTLTVATRRTAGAVSAKEMVLGPGKSLLL